MNTSCTYLTVLNTWKLYKVSLWLLLVETVLNLAVIRCCRGAPVATAPPTGSHRTGFSNDFIPKVRLLFTKHIVGRLHLQIFKFHFLKTLKLLHKSAVLSWIWQNDDRWFSRKELFHGRRPFWTVATNVGQSEFSPAFKLLWKLSKPSVDSGDWGEGSSCDQTGHTPPLSPPEEADWYSRTATSWQNLF